VAGLPLWPAAFSQEIHLAHPDYGYSEKYRQKVGAIDPEEGFSWYAGI
jgi:hypothetical protein